MVSASPLASVVWKSSSVLFSFVFLDVGVVPGHEERSPFTLRHSHNDFCDPPEVFLAPKSADCAVLFFSVEDAVVVKPKHIFGARSSAEHTVCIDACACAQTICCAFCQALPQFALSRTHDTVSLFHKHQDDSAPWATTVLQRSTRR